MKIYLAAKFEAKLVMRGVKLMIEELGHKVVSTWLDEESLETTVTDAMKLQYALRDLSEIEDADLLILDTYDDNLRGGREVEYGYARALGKQTWVMGPQRNVFHHLAPHFDSWLDVRDSLRKEL